METRLSVLHVETDRIYDAVSTYNGIRNRLLVVNVGLYEPKLRIVSTKFPECPIRMP